ncbi:MULTISPECIES: flavin reductase family protein [unclassified Mesorhizobium]|uniref:flavin reductase family protein n=1 Tax=unclassified Mesorhizobium TaxID=325217 RepID=UPI000FCA9CCD|nr:MULTISPECIES: flavin reductase family protein [unclassified Mesorhizobium]RUW32465.1 flavin reductase [Mesorhizobium sp. M1E.F.Ca.ET.041.01.1.1]RWD91866.1 MAG: flavin reductase [Mesorhizobium sp.]RWD95777.1 MAG: flavin reductase [Mesorhizobium sp.]TIV54838.1 MAG: flavin reductase [Mesorhizobium sp.]
MQRQSNFDPAGFWKLLGIRPVAVPIVAARDADGPAGLLALSATHVSASPPAMLVAIGNSTSALKTVTTSKAFAISYLPEGAGEVADIFGGKRSLSGADRFGTARWTSLTTGSPVFADAVLAFDCEVAQVFEHEGTQLVVGRIVDSIADASRRPLIFAGGRYRVLPTE